MLLARAYGVPLKAARQAISWGIGKRCAEFADRSTEDRGRAFIAALNALKPRPKPEPSTAAIPVTFAPFAELTARFTAEAA